MTQRRRPRRRDGGYYHVTDNEWIAPARRGFVQQCCDCGLVHVTDYTIEDERPIFRTRVDRRLTAAARRKFNFTGDDE